MRTLPIVLGVLIIGAVVSQFVRRPAPPGAAGEPRGGGAGFSAGDVGGPTEFECERDEQYVQSHRLDDQQFFAIRDTGRDQMRTWYTGLRQSLGAQFEPRMKEMAHELTVAKLRDNDQYQDPFPITPPG